MTIRSDSELAAAISAGDEAVATAFDERFRGRIEAIARKRGVPVSDCGDIAQEVLAYAFRQIRDGKFRGTAALSTWLYPIINGKIADYWRARKSSQPVSLEAVLDSEQAVVMSNSNDDIVAVHQALARLPDNEHLLLWLHEAEKYTLKEIGQLIGLGKSAVAERLEHARAHFRAVIRDGGRPSPPKRLKE